MLILVDPFWRLLILHFEIIFLGEVSVRFEGICFLFFLLKSHLLVLLLLFSFLSFFVKSVESLLTFLICDLLILIVLSWLFLRREVVVLLLFWLLRSRLLSNQGCRFFRDQRLTLMDRSGAPRHPFEFVVFVHLRGEGAFFQLFLLNLCNLFLCVFLLQLLVLVESFMELRDWLRTGSVFSGKEWRSLEPILNHPFSPLPQVVLVGIRFSSIIVLDGA